MLSIREAMFAGELGTAHAFKNDGSFKAVVRCDTLGEISFISDNLLAIFGDNISQSCLHLLQDFVHSNPEELSRFHKILEITRDLEQKCAFNQEVQDWRGKHLPMTICTAPLRGEDQAILYILVLFEHRVEASSIQEIIDLTQSIDIQATSDPPKRPVKDIASWSSFRSLRSLRDEIMHQEDKTTGMEGNESAQSLQAEQYLPDSPCNSTEFSCFLCVPPASAASDDSRRARRPRAAATPRPTPTQPAPPPALGGRPAAIGSSRDGEACGGGGGFGSCSNSSLGSASGLGSGYGSSGSGGSATDGKAAHRRNVGGGGGAGAGRTGSPESDLVILTAPLAAAGTAPHGP